MSEKEFAQGIYFNEPSENAPDFIIGRLSLAPEKLIPWLQGQKTNDKGYVNCQIKIAKSGKPYVEIDNWQPTKGKQRSAPQPQSFGEMSADGFGGEDVPF